MFKIEDTNIQVTRGDAGVILLSAEMGENSEDYVFNIGDIIRMKVFPKKDHSNIVLEKIINVTEQTTSIEIILTKEDTKIGDLINKKVDYWYEIELNPDTNPQTIIGYDEDGAKIFSLYPEGGDT